jgi:hypothetical protein
MRLSRAARTYLAAADSAGLPDDESFPGRALRSHVEFGSQVACGIRAPGPVTTCTRCAKFRYARGTARTAG